jgi:hypothetical protein
MEKPGMGGRRKPAGAGLLSRPKILTAALLAGVCGFLFSPPLWAQEPRGELLVRTETAPEQPAAGGIWTLTFLVNHPRPGEVDIVPPPLPPALALESLRREARFVKNERWTLVEYRFTIRGSGRIRLAPFEIASPQGRARSAPLSLEVRAAGGLEDFHPRLVWENIPPRLALGEALEFSLRLVDGDPDRPPPAAAVLLPPVPRDCILEALEARPGDGDSGRLLRLRLIPLAAGEFSLPAAAVRSGDLTLERPPLRIPVVSPRTFQGGRP